MAELTEEFMNDNDVPMAESPKARGTGAPRLRTFAPRVEAAPDPQQERLARIREMGPEQLEEEQQNFYKSSASRLKLSMDKTRAAIRCGFAR